MRLTRRNRPLGFQMNMTPMIDVTFQLLIFFMTASQISQLDKEPVRLPELKGNVDKDKADLTINVTKEETIKIQGTIVDVPRIAEMVQEIIKSKPGGVTSVSIMIRADEKATSRTVNQIFVRLKRLGILESRIAVQVPQ